MTFRKPLPLETTIEEPAAAFGELRGWMQAKIVRLGKRAWPDRIFIRAGRIIFIEFKRPGEEPTVQQYKRHRDLKSHGAEVFWVDNLEDAKRILM